MTPKSKTPAFKPGDTVRVDWKVEKGKEGRVQGFEGVVIAIKGKKDYKTFTVRKIATHGIGVERIFPLYSPLLKNLEVIRHGKPRRAKLYYLRDRTGKKALKVKKDPSYN